MFKKDLVWELGFLIIVIISIFLTSSSQYKNGRIDLCNEYGGKYLYNGSCISNEEYNLRYNYSNGNRYKVPEIQEINLVALNG